MNGILADEMGLGKTIQAIAMLAWLFEHDGDKGPHLICAPLSTLPNWQREIAQWYPPFNVVVYKGPPDQRREIERKYFSKNSNLNVIITSYEFAHKDKSALSKNDYSFVIIDEAHKIKNHAGKLSQALSQLKSRNRLLLTGTPLQNNPRELWSLLNFLLPSVFNDHHRFEEWFSAPFENRGEKVQLDEEEHLLIVAQLHDVLRPFIFRRLKINVADQLPKKKERTILCELSALKRQCMKPWKNIIHMLHLISKWLK